MTRRIVASVAVAVIGFQVAELSPPPTAQIAKRCMTYSYLAYPFKRPGISKGSGDREAYRKDCIARHGEVPKPEQPASPKQSG